ncbi:hypothetical protein QUF58_01765 [Anaerolineales bacterium HSG24]|nr:hypothetical protein [Anaerolineales bacterium HSG24]
MAKKTSGVSDIYEPTAVFFQSPPEPEPTAEDEPTTPKPERKKRKDATGRKKDYHKNSRMVATRLPNDIVEQIRAIAESDNLSVSAWLGALILRELKAIDSPESPNC